MQTKSATKVDTVIGRNIRKLRLEADLSQTDLAKLVGVSFQQIQKYENGSNRIAASRLLKLAKALDQPITAFLPEEKLAA